MMEEIKLIFFENPIDNKIIKATIHKTGKIYFSKGAETLLNIVENMYFKIGFNDKDTNIYIIPTLKKEEGFKVSKAGPYHYIDLKRIFDKRNIEYKETIVIYDIKDENINEEKGFVLIRRK